MRWEHLRRSQNVEDRRHQRASGAGAGGFKLGGAGILIAIIIAFVVGPKEGLSFFMQNAQNSAQHTSSELQTIGEDIDDEAEDFIKAVLGSTEDIWNKQFSQLGRQAPPWAHSTILRIRPSTLISASLMISKTNMELLETLPKPMS